ncbi:ZapG family protein [Neptunicella marina]|uniref:DUF1043 family protein n=1 Tax=Neptunicella marina TaxID=2125989 RepID=A0A8J6IRW3_9ALTE|nr:DUF1043 family protein [Neptunicella marina]MBC3765259.1 DUF1043 family protein [Neptunicella marina]
MDFITGLLLLIIGAVVGFFAAQFWLNKQNNADKEKNVENTIRDILLQQTQIHVAESRQVLTSIEQKCQALRNQLEHFEHNVSEMQNQPEDGKLAFFGEQANVYLRHNVTKSKPEKTSADYQPLDYSAGNSGLLNSENKPQKQTAE